MDVGVFPKLAGNRFGFLEIRAMDWAGFILAKLVGRDFRDRKTDFANFLMVSVRRKHWPQSLQEWKPMKNIWSLEDDPSLFEGNISLDSFWKLLPRPLKLHPLWDVGWSIRPYYEMTVRLVVHKPLSKLTIDGVSYIPWNYQQTPLKIVRQIPQKETI